MAYDTHRFCWHGLVTPQPDKAAAFYSDVLGWKADATMFSVSGAPIADYGVPSDPGAPARWENYLRVEDVDAVAQRAVANGGTIAVAAQDIPPGRFCVVQAPSGARLGLFHEADPSKAEHHPGGVGGVFWSELQTQSLEQDVAWLKATFDFTSEEIPLPDGGTYYMLYHGGMPRTGAKKCVLADAPSMWITWFQVEDCDAAVGRIESDGGTCLNPPLNMPEVGRLSIVADNTGAVFGVIKPG